MQYVLAKFGVELDHLSDYPIIIQASYKFEHQLRTFSVNVFSGSNLLALIGESLTSDLVKLTPIFTKILTSCPYNCWPLLLRISVEIGRHKDAMVEKAG